MISYIVYALINMTRATFTHVFLYEMIGDVKENRDLILYTSHRLKRGTIPSNMHNIQPHLPWLYFVHIANTDMFSTANNVYKI